ncbi:TrkH family potassium uptake protein [Desulfospira joergensenii]|uniref:TrkH family potassium uptake protein n=1 Tax=Desulfospira joergensenii TaxID=53329 RepID=UPI0003B799E7|nr:TrkH family potassium uptake protein [Desulfospira joergensenii]
MDFKRKPRRKTWAASISQSPGRLSILMYGLLIFMGTFLLLLPVSTVSGRLPFIDAMFTAASAVCVTGLTVADTASTFTLFGKSVILGLIQIGGIGIMVLSTAFLFSMGRRVSMTGRQMIRDTYSYGEGKGMKSLVKDVLRFTFAIEFIGALFMFSRFYGLQPLDKAVGYAVFHSVSAFCNAGFSLFPDSFTGFGRDWVMNIDICMLIILGGIGFVVLAEIRQKFSLSRRFWSDFSLHTKLTLSGTLLLLVGSTAAILLLEWSNTLGGMALPHKALAAFFQAVNARTAGFNTVDIGNLANETLFITILLMFIGTAPGSCGGGIKVTTFFSMVILGISRFRGQEHPHVFYRRISAESISKAVSLVMISLTIIIVGIILLQQVAIGDISHRLSRGAFLEVMFEVVSAFGTVGLSTGITPEFSTPGKLILILMMFIGRLGPLVVAISASKKATPKPYSYAQENIMIG